MKRRQADTFSTTKPSKRPRSRRELESHIQLLLLLLQHNLDKVFQRRRDR